VEDTIVIIKFRKSINKELFINFCIWIFSHVHLHPYAFFFISYLIHVIIYIYAILHIIQCKCFLCPCFSRYFYGVILKEIFSWHQHLYLTKCQVDDDNRTENEGLNYFNWQDKLNIFTYQRVWLDNIKSCDRA
jgi:hypothetical protein